VSRGAIRTAVADLLPNQPERLVPTAVAEPAVTRIEMPGKIARFLQDRSDLEEPEMQALDAGRAVRRGAGYSLHVTATVPVHQALLSAAAALNADGASSADRKAYRIYADRLSTAIKRTDPT
jgi:putative DNA-invertase from lambdoid prophage Rac